jgi:spore germination protein YaaH
VLAYWSVYGSPAGPLADITAHAGSITWLSPYWYTLAGSAALSSHETDHAQVDRTAAGVRVPVLPLINQGAGVTQLLGTASGRTAAASAIGKLVRANPAFGGVVIDFEALPPSSTTAFTDFIQAVRTALPSGDVLGVAVMPKAASPGPSYARVFNYQALGQIADFIQIMTYDRHSDGGSAGPVSPNNWVAQVARYAASVIPPEKILIGVPGYGYNWVGTSAATVTDVQAAQLATSLGITPTLDPLSGEYHYSYTRGGVRHTVWYESPQGFAGKERIVRQYGLAGMALWTLGGEAAAFWSNIGD